MNARRDFLQKITWGVLLVVIAAVLILVGLTGVSLLHAVPLIILCMGIWILAAGTSFYMRAWGIVLSVLGGLWLLSWTAALSTYVAIGIFLAVTGILIILGSRK